MKKILLTLVLALTGLELWAQLPPTLTNQMPRRFPRFGNTNGPVTLPRYPSPSPGISSLQGGVSNLPGAAVSAPGAGASAPDAAAGAPGAAAAGAPGGAAGAQGAAAGAPGAAAGVPGGAAGAAAPAEEMIAPGTIDFEGVELNQVLLIYAKLVNRTLLRAALPQAQIILKTQTPLTKSEAIEALQAVLALNGVSLVNIGDKFVKVLPSTDAGTSGGELDQSSSTTNMPDLGSYVTHIVQLQYVKPTAMVQFITPFAKLPNAAIPLDDNGILVLRDFAENVKRMLEMIKKIDVSIPAEYISEVIPIRYAKVDDIANALNALGGSGSGASVSIGTSPGSGQISGLAGNRSSGLSGMGGVGGVGGGFGGVGGGVGGAFGSQARTGLTTPNGTPSGGTTFQGRLSNLINATMGGGAGGKQDQIQLFGQTKIIPNESSSSLLIYATRTDMEVIKGIIAKLDVPLAQVLIEAVIIDYSLGPDTFNFGISAAQNPATLGGTSGNNSVVGAGGGNNGANLLHNLASLTGNGTNGFGNNLGSGLSYFGNIGQSWDVAMTAVAADSHASIIQRPRIQTSQAKPAQFFVGDTVPYVTGNSYGSAYGNGVSYSQLSVGVELDVTPFINPDGLVVMDIQQEIDELNGTTPIANVGDVPNTIKRTLNAEIAVKDKDTVMLGGFIKSSKSTGRSGVPWLMDIPYLGNLFTQRKDSKAREELIVMMRPTVLQTPELAAKNTIKEQQRLPGVSATAAESAEEERKLIDAERKREQKRFQNTQQYDGFFNPEPEATSTNAPAAATPPQTGVLPQTWPPAGVGAANPVPPGVSPDSTAAQQKAAAALAQRMAELNRATNAPGK
jgi:type II secretory pathway component GspD/PulD (secretin)